MHPFKMTSMTSHSGLTKSRLRISEDLNLKFHQQKNGEEKINEDANFIVTELLIHRLFSPFLLGLVTSAST